MTENDLLNTYREMLGSFAGIDGGWFCVTCQQFETADVTIRSVTYHRTPKGLHQIRPLAALQRVPDSWLTATSPATSGRFIGVF